jgi:hypothetical protein
MLDTRYADCECVTLVCDNLNTHSKGAFYEAYEPEIARAYVKRIKFCYTPKHGSWLNVAECELSCLTSLNALFSRSYRKEEPVATPLFIPQIVLGQVMADFGPLQFRTAMANPS